MDSCPSTNDVINAPDESGLLPHRVKSCRKVRLFTRRSTRDNFWRKQLGWMTSCDVERVNDALSAVQPCAEHPEYEKLPYGAKLKGIQEQYEKYVPRIYVPNKYNISMAMKGGSEKASWHQKEHLGAPAATSLSPGAVLGATVDTEPSTSGDGRVDALPLAPSATPVKNKVRWKKAAHAELLRSAIKAPPLNGKLLRSADGLCELASQLRASDMEEWDVNTVKRHARKMFHEA